jgi:hypothetical protein
MKICRNLISKLSIVAGLALALAASRGLAQTILTTSYTNMFDTDGNTTYFAGSGSVASWLYWWGLIGGNAGVTNDPSMNVTGDTNNYGSLYLPMEFGPAGNQQAVFGTFSGNAWSSSVVIPLNIITQLCFDIHVQPGDKPDASGDFGQITMALIDPTWAGGDYAYFSGITIPGAATNGWVHLVDTNTAGDLLKMETAGFTKAAGVGFIYASWGGYPTAPVTFWIDNVAVLTAAAPPPPPPPPTMSLLSPAVQGLNLFTGNGASLYNRENLETVNPDYSWVGASGPVSYSFTITNYPVAAGDAVQCQIFLVPNPGTESGPDWNEPNVVFLDLESWTPGGGGAEWSFRYKTNQPNANSMIYGTGTLASIGSTSVLGTYTVTFNNNTNVTMSMPGGVSTNISIPDASGATTALFASGVKLYFGVQGGNAGGTSDHIVASEFKVTGLGAADFDDDFIKDAGTLNTNLWAVNAAYPNCVQLLGPGNPWWISWTTPAIGYTLDTTAALSKDTVWTPVTTYTPIQNGSFYTQLISTNDLQPGKDAFFAAIKRTFSQLLVVLPGQTLAPNTPTGVKGTPTPVSVSNNSGEEDVTVYAVDANFYPVAGSTDSIALTSTDPGQIANTPPPKAMVNGQVTFNMANLPETFFFYTPGTWTITATDTTDTSIKAGTSSSVMVGP